MLMKKSLILFFAIIILNLFPFVLANKIEISTIGESFSAGKNITLQINLYDEQNNLINDNVLIVLEDAEKTARIEKTVPSNKLVYIDLGENPIAGPWTINAKYQNPNTNEVSELTEFFTIKPNEVVEFEIEGDMLTVTNIGNIEYTRDIYITIGNTIGEPKKIDLGIGESVKFRLIAPDGTYRVIVTDGETTITRAGVTLTGKAIGILDERLVTGENPITGGIKPEEKDESFYYNLKNNNFVYIFLIVIIGAGILLAVERRYRKKL